MARNCERRLATSVEVKPAERRRSKPWGCAGGCVVACCLLEPAADGETGGMLSEGEVAAAAVAAASASASSSESVRWPVAEMEQWM